MGARTVVRVKGLLMAVPVRVLTMVVRTVVPVARGRLMVGPTPVGRMAALMAVPAEALGVDEY
jgi:hypothetical protein